MNERAQLCVHAVQQARAGHAAQSRLRDLNVHLHGGVYNDIARSNQCKRALGANARRGRGGTVRARRTFPAFGGPVNQVKTG